MRHRGRLFGGVFLLVVAPVLGSCGSAGEAVQASGAAAAEEPRTPTRVVNVETMTAQAEPFAERITVTGMLEADRDVTVASEEQGVVREVFVEKGQRVAAGQPIVRIDDRVLRAQHEQAVSAAALARETYERQRRLWEDEEMGTEIAYLQAKYGAEMAEANARQLEARLERTVVRAPIGGFLEDRQVEIGTMVQPGATVARIVDADPLKVAAGVPERYAGQIAAGGEADIGLEAEGLGEMRGNIAFVGSVVDARTRTFPIEVDVPNSGGELKPGLVARVRLARRVIEQAIVVPREAVLRSATGYLVYVVHEEEGQTTARARAVTMGAGQGRNVVIESGLEPGERIVIVGQQQLADGDHVRLPSTGEEATDER